MIEILNLTAIGQNMDQIFPTMKIFKEKLQEEIIIMQQQGSYKKNFSESSMNKELNDSKKIDQIKVSYDTQNKVTNDKEEAEAKVV